MPSGLMDIDFIRERFRLGKYRLTRHALERRITRGISTEEIEEAVREGDIIEEYPEDKYGPSALIFGKTAQKRPLHVQCSYSDIVWVITVYEPDEKEWIDLKTRRV